MRAYKKWGDRMKRIGIIPNKLKDKQFAVTEEVAKWLIDAGIDVYMTEEDQVELDASIKVHCTPDIYKECDSIIVIGGDGTILSVAEEACKYQIPIIGINLGRVGFLADIEPQDVRQSLSKLLKDDYTIEERMMLEATVVAPNGETYVFHALNDINVTRASFSRLVEFEIRVNKELSDVYPADGIIVSTPTGSTAYNLSAGGPIVVPHAKNYIITPVCPHTIYSRSIILSGDDEVDITALEGHDQSTALSIDGKLKMYLTPNHYVRIKKSPYVTSLIKCSERKFFDILREKIVERRR